MSEQNTNKRQLSLPGKLTASVDTLTFHNRYVKMMIEGRKPQKKDGKTVSGIIGLKLFAAITRDCIKSAQADDPFADLVLITLEQSEQRCRDKLISLSKKVDEALSIVPTGVSLSGVESVEPMYFQVAFSANPYASRAAYLLLNFDECLNKVWAARFKGLLGTNEANDFNQLAQRAVRAYFSKAKIYRHFGINRKDIVLTTARGAEAIKHYQRHHLELSEPVIKRELRGQFAPVINPAIIAQSSSTGFDEGL